MVAVGFFLRVSLFALYVVATCGSSLKGYQSTGQSSSGSNAAASYPSYRGGAPRYAAAPYSAVGGAYHAASMPTFVQGSGVSQPVLLASGVNDYGSSVGVQAAGMSPVASAGQASTLVSGLPGAAYVASPQLYVPVEEYGAGSQDEQAETQWAVPTTVFSEGGSADLHDLGDILPPAALAPQGPTLRSGETSSVTKEAELGNYQQQTEEFGYPAFPASSGQGFGQGLATVLGQGPATVFGQGAYLGGFRPVSLGKFDWMLLYGLYPRGTYSTFSQNHEAGKDYSQAVHYLKEHVTSSHGSGQQKKFFPGAR